MSDFLNNLKKDLEKGEFNSEAAKKITEVNSLADEKMIGTQTGEDGTEVKSQKTVEELEEAVKNRLQDAGIKHVSEEEMLAANLEYAETMEKIKRSDYINKQMALLIDMEDMIRLSVLDMMSFVDSVEKMVILHPENKYKEISNFGEIETLVNKLKNNYKIKE